MNLQHLCSAPHVTVSYDTWNNWLFIDWEGELTLPTVQYACLELAHCFLAHPYPRVLNCNTLVTAIDWEVANWLADTFFPHLRLAGVEQLAWVYAPTVRGRDVAESICQRLPLALKVALFGDVEQAVTWLQQTQPDVAGSHGLPQRPASAEAKLTRVVHSFDQLVGGAPAAAVR